MYLLCDAIPFCYGPASALESLLIEIYGNLSGNITADVFATGSTREFLARSRIPARLLPVDSEDLQALESIDVSKYDVFLDVCNPASYRSMIKKGLCIIYLDFLLWMHCGPPGDHFRADLYLAENYPGTQDWVRIRGRDVPNLRTIPPLVQPVVRYPEPNTLLVGLGGLFSRLTVPGVNTNYASFVIKHLVPIIEESRFERVNVACADAVAETLTNTIKASTKFVFKAFSHSDFLDLVSTCEAFISHPGLYAPFEAMMGGVPTAFLPPSNYTQILQLRHFRKIGLANFSFSWDDMGTNFIPSDLPEPEGVAAVLNQISDAESSQEHVEALQHVIARFLDLNSGRLSEIGAEQRAICKNFGKNGPQIAAEIILQWMQKPFSRASKR